MSSLDLSFEHGAFRDDIQALRGLAILLVVLHHSDLVEVLPAGYLGVDIFFVVSGYLITGILVKGINQSTFSFRSFYFRRAKRLLPAAYVTFLATTLLSPLFLSRPEMRDFIWQLLGAVTFTGNIALWMQTGYFEGAADLKPLLHVWSLSIEEQYYLLVPAALVLVPQRFWRTGAFVVLVGSLALCFALVSIKPGATFYLLPTRAWELVLGSIGVLVLDERQGAWLAPFFWLALLALLVVPFFPTGAPHPGPDALIVCIATLVVILRRHPVLGRSLPVQGLARMGDISYSLYLVHWPVMALAANSWVAPMPVAVQFGMVFISLVLSYALFRWVERPIRKLNIQYNHTFIFVVLGATSALLLLGFVVYHVRFQENYVDYAHVRRVNHGFSAACEFGDTFVFKPECRNSDAPVVLVWGDSYAMHLVDGIAKWTNLGLVQATKTRCGPFIDISAFKTDGFYNRRWAEDCLSFNQSVMKYLAQSATVEVVVLSSIILQYLAGSRLITIARSNASGSQGVLIELDGSEDIAVESLRATIAAIRSLGKRVVLVAPPPTSGFDVGRCLELTANNQAVFGADNKSCAISESSYRTYMSDVLSFLHRVNRAADLPIIRFDDFLCRAGICAVELDGILLYGDRGHLTYDGSRILGQRMELAGRLLAEAR